MAYEIVWEATGAQFVFKKEFSSEDVLRANEEFASDSRSSDAKYAIYNLIDVQEFPIESKAIRKVAEMDARLFAVNPDMKFAIVAAQLVMKGLTRMYEVYLEFATGGDRWDTEIFSSIDDARKWIGA